MPEQESPKVVLVDSMTRGEKKKAEDNLPKKGFFSRLRERFSSKKETTEKTPAKEEKVPLGREDVERFRIEKAQHVETRKQFGEVKRMAHLEKLERFKNPEEAVYFLAGATEKEWRAKKLDEIYGKGAIGKFKQFLAGEFDFEIGMDGEIKRSAWNRLAEIGKATLKTLFNRQTVVAAGTLGVIGLLTGGVGLGAGVATLLGTAVGRGVGEAWSALNGGERKLREEIASRQYDQWAKGREIAMEVVRLRNEGAPQEEINKKTAEVIEFMYSPSSEVVKKQMELTVTKNKHDKIKNTLGMIGGMAGLATHMGLGGLQDMLHHLDINGDKIYHNVDMINGKYHYIYNNATEFAQAKAAGVSALNLPGGEHAHVIAEKGTGLTQYLWGVGKNFARDFGVLGATYLASLTAKDAKFKTEMGVADSQKYEKEQLLEALGIAKKTEGKNENAEEGDEKENKEHPFAIGQAVSIKDGDEKKLAAIERIEDDRIYFIDYINKKSLSISWDNILKNPDLVIIEADDMSSLAEKLPVSTKFGRNELLEKLSEKQAGLKSFEIKNGQTVFDIDGNKLEINKYQLDENAIDLEKNGITLTDQNGKKHECFLPWFLHHLDQFGTIKKTGAENPREQKSSSEQKSHYQEKIKKLIQEINQGKNYKGIFSTADKYLWQIEGYGNKLKNESDDLYRGYLMVEKENIPAMVEILREIAKEKVKQNKNLSFKWLIGKGDVNRINKEKSYGEYENLQDPDPRIVIYGDTAENIQDIIKELTTDTRWAESIRKLSEKRSGKARRPGTNAYIDPEGREWRVINYNDKPGYSEDEAKDVDWRNKKLGSKSVRTT